MGSAFSPVETMVVAPAAIQSSASHQGLTHVHQRFQLLTFFIDLYYYYFFSQNKFRLWPTLYSAAGSHKTVLLSSCIYGDHFIHGQIQTGTQHFRFLSVFSTKLMASKVM